MPGHVQMAASKPEQLSFSATITDVDDDTVALDETFFFAESGGQPADRGTLAGISVTDVQHNDDINYHRVEDVSEFAVGDTVDGEIDSAFRRYCTRAHTASHVVYGAANRELGDIGYGGFSIGESKVRIDLTSNETIDETTILRIERLANQAVWESRPVSWSEIPSNVAKRSDDVAFNVATEDGFAESEQVRIVEIEGWDRAACGGTHVENTAEIGPIHLFDRSNPGQGLTRVEFAVGTEAVDQIINMHQNVTRAANLLQTTPQSLPAAIQALKGEVDSKDNRIAALEGTILEQHIADFETVTTASTRWKVGIVPSMATDQHGTILRNAIGTQQADVIVSLSGQDRTTIAVYSNGQVSAKSVVDVVTRKMGGGGGGNETAAQGGGIPTDPDSVLDLIQDVIIHQFP